MLTSHGAGSKGHMHQKHVGEDREGGGNGKRVARCGTGMCGGYVCCRGHCRAASTSQGVAFGTWKTWER